MYYCVVVFIFCHRPDKQVYKKYSKERLVSDIKGLYLDLLQKKALELVRQKKDKDRSLIS